MPYAPHLRSKQRKPGAEAEGYGFIRKYKYLIVKFGINYYMNKHQSIDDFTFNSVIGKGTYAKVCLVTRKSDGEVFAMKVLKKKYIVEKNQEEHIMT